MRKSRQEIEVRRRCAPQTEPTMEIVGKIVSASREGRSLGPRGGRVWRVVDLKLLPVHEENRLGAGKRRGL